jgi:hypothetical protein
MKTQEVARRLHHRETRVVEQGQRHQVRLREVGRTTEERKFKLRDHLLEALMADAQIEEVKEVEPTCRIEGKPTTRVGEEITSKEYKIAASVAIFFDLIPWLGYFSKKNTVVFAFGKFLKKFVFDVWV